MRTTKYVWIWTNAFSFSLQPTQPQIPAPKLCDISSGSVQWPWCDKNVNINDCLSWLMGREYSHASSFLSVLSVSLLIDGCLTAGKIFWPPKKEKFTPGFWTNFIDYFWFPVPEQENLPGQARCVARGFARFNVLWFRRARSTALCNVVTGGDYMD